MQFTWLHQHNLKLPMTLQTQVLLLPLQMTTFTGRPQLTSNANLEAPRRHLGEEM